MTTIAHPELEGLERYKFGWAAWDAAGESARRGLNEEVVRDISAKKNEPQWMLDLRLKGLKLFRRKPMPTWGSDLSGIDFENIKYFVRSTEKQAASWDDLPADIKNTYDKLGIPEAEKQRLIAGVAAQYESEVVYHKIREDLEEKGVIFKDTDTALKEHPDLFQEYFATVIPVGDNKFASLNTAVWSGGGLIYGPEGVHVEIPLQASFRGNTQNNRPFERTPIILDQDAYGHYVAGRTPPSYCSHALLVDAVSRSDTYPYVDVREDDVEMGHEASVSKISDDQLFYLMSRGMTEDEAMATIVRGFVEPIARELPMEYALELNRLIELQMEGAVG